MAGTDKRAAKAVGGPAIILVYPQLGENIGMCARAMLNCGLDRLRLVRPREMWPNDKAIRASAGALRVIDKAEVFDTLEEAIADCTCVWATTARDRDMVKPVMTAREAAHYSVTHFTTHNDDNSTALSDSAFIFGQEKCGLTNDHVALADKLIHVPLNPGFCSLNLAQAVLLITYEWYQAYLADRNLRGETNISHKTSIPEDININATTDTAATKGHVLELWARLDEALTKKGFYREANLKPTMQRNMRNMLTRSGFTDQEIRSLHGVLTSLLKP
jgi:tRNA/rRNA methyltransferase